MKNSLKITLCILLVAALFVAVSACKKEEEKPTPSKPQLVAPTTKPSESIETTPIYTRPGNEGNEDPESGETGENEEPVTPEDPVENPDNQGGDEDPENGNQGGSTGGNQGGNQGGSTGGNAGTDNNPQEDADDGQGVEGEITEPAVSAKPLTWSNLNSFNTDITKLSVAEARALCVDFFRYAKTALWTPDKSINYVKNSKGSKDNMVGGQLYGGLPYVGSASGNVYRLMDYINEGTGKVNMADALNITGAELSTSDLRYFGNQCANGAYVGWGRVINSVSLHYTAAMTRYNGYIPVGPYTYDASIKSWANEDGRHTTDITKANGQQVMFQSYAALKLADGMVNYTTAGHVIMCASEPVVVYKADGSVDGNASYIYIIDQAQAWVTQTTDDDRSYKYKSSVDAKVTFQELYNKGYLPYTFGEFLGTNAIEKSSASINVSGASVTFSQLCKAQITANYGVTDAYVIVTDGSGREVYKHAVRNSSSYGTTLKMAASGANVDSWGTLPTSGSYSVKVVIQLCTGERPTVYSGTLTV